MYSKLIYVSSVTLERPNIAPTTATANLFHLRYRMCEGGVDEQICYVHVPPELQRAIASSPAAAIEVVSLPSSDLLRKLMPDHPEALLTGVVSANGHAATSFPPSVARARRHRMGLGACLTAAGAAAVAFGQGLLGAVLCGAGVRALTTAEAMPGPSALKFNPRLLHRSNPATS